MRAQEAEQLLAQTVREEAVAKAARLLTNRSIQRFEVPRFDPLRSRMEAEHNRREQEYRSRGYFWSRRPEAPRQPALPDLQHDYFWPVTRWTEIGKPIKTDGIALKSDGELHSYCDKPGSPHELLEPRFSSEPITDGQIASVGVLRPRHVEWAIERWHQLLETITEGPTTIHLHFKVHV